METFKTISKHFKLEKYVTSVNVEKHHITLSSFRCSALKLMIEEGCFRGIEHNLRIRPLCPVNIIEDDYHFLLVCLVCRELCKSHLPKFYCRWPSKNKFIKLLIDEQVSVMKKLVKFVYLANEKWKFLLSNVPDKAAIAKEGHKFGYIHHLH